MNQFKNPYFISGLLIVNLIFFSSLIYSLIGGKIPVDTAIYKNGVLVATFPFNPIQIPPFGTDDAGNNLFFELLIGAKYTIGIAVIVSVCRLILSSVVGLFIGQVSDKYVRYFKGFSNAFNYMPVAILCYLLLKQVLTGVGVPPVFSDSFLIRVLFEILILILVALPATSLLIGNEVRNCLKTDYITSSRLLGGSRLHIILSHVWLYMKPRLWIYLLEQIVQVLLLLCHLGLLHLFFGGTSQLLIHGASVYLSMSNEWSGLIGKSYDRLILSPWMAIFPLVAFAITILGFNLMLEGVKAPRISRLGKKSPSNSPVLPDHSLLPQESFTQIKKVGGAEQ